MVRDALHAAFKFSPAFSAYSAGSHSVIYPDWIEGMKPEQKVLSLVAWPRPEPCVLASLLYALQYDFDVQTITTHPPVPNRG